MDHGEGRMKRLRGGVKGEYKNKREKKKRIGHTHTLTTMTTASYRSQ